MSIDLTGGVSGIITIFSAGLLDGIHPCAIAILVFFVAFLLSLRESRSRVLLLGSLYIGVIFLTHLGLGVGFFSGLHFFEGHLLAKIGAVALIFMGFYNIGKYFYPGFKLGFSPAGMSIERAKKLLQRSSVPAVVLAAFLVALCSIPCSAGVYAAISALLASRTTYFRGLLYLVLYNLAFVTPLIVILALSLNPVTLAAFGELQQKYKRQQRLVIGLFLILLGLAFVFYVF